jgi:hypothetical protein
VSFLAESNDKKYTKTASRSPEIIVLPFPDINASWLADEI